MNYIKNIEQAKVVTLSQKVSAGEGQVVSKTLAQNPYVSLTIFAFAQGEEIGTHTSTGDAMVTVLEGEGRFIVGDEEFKVACGESLVMPANKPHSVHADVAFKMVLLVIFPTN